MRIALAGGVGFVGRNLTSLLIDQGHDVTVFDNVPQNLFNHEGACYVKSDLSKKGSWQNFMAKQDVVINLAGASIFQRWNESRKREMRLSRIEVTKNIVKVFASEENRCKLLVNASAVGYYGYKDHGEVDESSPAGDDFLAILARDWENAALEAERLGVRVVLLRFGTILGHGGGAFPELKKSFDRFTGARLGTGRQWFPWIHLHDLLNIIVFILSRDDVVGPINCVSPGIVQNSELTKIFRASSRKISLIPFVPGFLLRIFLGEFAVHILKSPRVISSRLKNLGVELKYESLDRALQNLFGK